MKTANKKYLNPVLAALFSAFIAVCSQITVVLPSGIPLTLQTFAVILCGYVLGVKWSAAAVTVILLTGLCGIPVFSSFGAGPYFFAGPTGGFLIGFLPLCILCSLSLKFKKRLFSILFSLFSLLLFYFIGTIWYCVVTGTPFISGFLVAATPFIPKDVLCAFTALFVAFRIKRKIC